MTREERAVLTFILIIVIIVSVFIGGVINYRSGFNDGAASVDTRTPNFETSFTGGYVVIGIYIYAYYDEPTVREPAFFGVRFSKIGLKYTNITIDLVSTLSERYSPPGETISLVGFAFNLDNITAAAAFAYRQMSILIFGRGSSLEVPSVIRSCDIRIFEWEGEG